MGERQFRDARSVTVEEGVTKNEESISPLLPEIIKGSLYLLFRAGVDEANWYPERSSRLLRLLHLELRVGILRVHQRSKTARIRGEFMQKTQALRGQQIAEECRPSNFPPGRLRLATSPSLVGSLPMANTIGIDVVARLAASAATGVPAAITLT